MKKLIALLLCLVMLAALSACSKEEQPETTADPQPSQQEPTQAQEAHDHVHINYRGIETRFTVEDMTALEGRECDYLYDQNGTTIYIYNEIEFDSLYFTQVQYSFTEAYDRVSCTYTADPELDAAQIEQDTERVLAEYKQILTDTFGEGTESEQHSGTYFNWIDHTDNYIILTRINETTIQVAYYICAEA